MPSPGSRQTVGLQLYTLREACSSDLLGTLERVAEIGYAAVEWFGGLFGAPADVVSARLAELDLEVVALHAPLEDLEGRVGEVEALAGILDCGRLVCPWLSEARRARPDVYEEVGRFLDRLGGDLLERRLRLCYHNHDFEIGERPEEDGLERLAAVSDAERLGFELDAYWLAYAGADPAERIRRFGDRVHLVHLKDGSLRRVGFTPLGKGDVDLPAVVEAAQGVGVEAFVVEQDEADGSPFDAVAESFAYLKGIGLVEGQR